MFKIKHFLILILALILVSFVCGTLVSLGDRRAQIGEINRLRDSILVYEVEIDNLKEKVWEKDVVIATKREAIEAGLLEQDRLKALNYRRASHITRLEADVKAYRDSIPLPDSVFIVDTVLVEAGETQNTYLKIPFDFGFNEDHLSLDVGITNNREAWFDLDCHIPLTITMGTKDRQVASVTTPSPYVRITDFEVVQIERNIYIPPWATHTATGLAGFGLGFLLWGR